MSTTTTTASAAPAAVAAKPSTALKSSVEALLKADKQQAIAADGVRSVAKTETAKHNWSKSQLQAMLLQLGIDPARASEFTGFVFPANNAAREHLDKAMAFNAKQTDHKKRIAKPVILALQRDKEGTLTLEKALEDFKAKQGISGSPKGARTPDQTNSTKKKTEAEIEEELNNLLAAALNFGKKNGYDADDVTACFEEQRDNVVFKEETDGDADNDK